MFYFREVPKQTCLHAQPFPRRRGGSPSGSVWLCRSQPTKDIPEMSRQGGRNGEINKKPCAFQASVGKQKEKYERAVNDREGSGEEFLMLLTRAVRAVEFPPSRYRALGTSRAPRRSFDRWFNLKIGASQHMVFLSRFHSPIYSSLIYPEPPRLLSVSPCSLAHAVKVTSPARRTATELCCGCCCLVYV